MRARERHADVLSEGRRQNTAYDTEHIDGSNPLAFSADQIPRLKIGDWYKVPDERGDEIEAQLCDGIVIKAQE
jgi:hypothetical protein